MKAITTKYLTATDTKPARLVASDMDGNRATVSYHDSSDAHWNDPHHRAALALCAKLNWHGRLMDGAIKGGRVYVFDDGTDHLHT